MKNKILQTIKKGGVAVIPTDTLYGIVASALNPYAVQRVYDIKHRNPDKATIILIPDMGTLGDFGIVLNDFQKGIVDEKWPGPNTLIFDIPSDVHVSDDDKTYVGILQKTNIDSWRYVHRGTGALAFRVPDDEYLCKVLRDTGPIIAPSANPEGMPPATTIDQARGYFGDTVDVYVDGGELTGHPSRIFRVGIDDVEQMR